MKLKQLYNEIKIIGGHNVTPEMVEELDTKLYRISYTNETAQKMRGNLLDKY